MKEQLHMKLGDKISSHQEKMDYVEMKIDAADSEFQKLSSKPKPGHGRKGEPDEEEEVDMIGIVETLSRQLQRVYSTVTGTEASRPNLCMLAETEEALDEYLRQVDYRKRVNKIAIDKLEKAKKVERKQAYTAKIQNTIEEAQQKKAKASEAAQRVALEHTGRRPMTRSEKVKIQKEKVSDKT